MTYKVLIVDDEPWSREVIKALGKWKELKLDVVGEANDGLKAMEKICSLTPSIIITDMRMPGLDGVEFLKVVNEKYKNIKIIIMSGYDDFMYLKQAIRSRAIEYLLKPIDPLELNEALRKCIYELDKEKQNSFNNLKNVHVFLNHDDLDEYLNYYQRVFSFLMELNERMVLETFAKLEEYIKKNVNEVDVISRIGYDFIMMIEEFILKNELSFNDIWDKDKLTEKIKGDWSTVEEVFNEMRELYCDAINAVMEIQNNKRHLDISQVVTYIQRNYKDTISLEAVAQYFHVSKEYLSRTFKTQKNETILDFIIRLRMEKARELIIENQLAIKNIASIVGYSDIAYFYKVFKKYYGLTPGSLRKQSQIYINKVQ